MEFVATMTLFAAAVLAAAANAIAILRYVEERRKLRKGGKED